MQHSFPHPSTIKSDFPPLGLRLWDKGFSRVSESGVRSLRETGAIPQPLLDPPDFCLHTYLAVLTQPAGHAYCLEGETD